MEIISSNSQAMEYIISWKEIIERVSKFDKSLKYYGVPRGGQYISAMLNPVDTIEEADVIIDDLIDSGRTMDRYFHYNKPFVALFDKRTEPELKDKWLVFPWELKEEPAEDNFARILQSIGEDPNREGLKETPKRYLKFMREFTEPKEFNFTSFDAEGTDEMIIQTNIPFYSLCEHHTVPFFGFANVAYIPNGKIVGLSKLSRCVDLYANRLQNQERITTQVAERLQNELNPKGVAVTLKAQHLCMAMRGVKKHDTWTMTSKMLGVFKDDEKARNEFLNLIK
jgi:GTP cyclohydrolase I